MRERGLRHEALPAAGWPVAGQERERRERQRDQRVGERVERLDAADEELEEARHPTPISRVRRATSYDITP
jgi:hypothetical protein